MTLTEEQLKAIALLLAASDRTKVGNFDLEDEQKARTIPGAMIDSSEEFTDAGELINRASQIEYDIEYRKSDCESRQWVKLDAFWFDEMKECIPLLMAEIERLRASLVEHEEHENQTHEVLGNILGTDDTLENVAKRAAARIKELEAELAEMHDNALEVAGYLAEKENLEDALVEELARGNYFDESQECEGYWWDRKNFTDETQKQYRDNARRQLQAEGKIGPDADAKPREGLYGKYRISKADGSPVDPNADYFVLRLDTDPVARRAAREYSYMTVDRKLALELQERITKYNPKMMDCINLQFFGVEKPRVWQITEERKAALWHAIKVLKENDIMEEPEEHLWDEEVTVLQAMLTEAGQ